MSDVSAFQPALDNSFFIMMTLGDSNTNLLVEISLSPLFPYISPSTHG